MKIIIKFLSIVFIILLSLQTYLYWTRGIAGTSILTTVLFWLGFTLFSQFIIFIFFRYYKRNDELRINLYLSTVALFFCVLSTELILQYVLKYNLVYNETNGDFFYESFHRENFDRHYLYTPYSDIDYKTKEFTYKRITNSLGIVDKEIEVLKTKNELRILCLGDSFTEGIGSIKESGSWPRVLEQMLRKVKNKKINVINAGIAGSDPAFQYTLLKEIFLPYKPDIVIVATNTVDLDEFMVRGGLERFSDEDLLRSKKAPSWEPLYAASFIFRFFIHNILNFTPLLLAPKQDQIERDLAIRKMQLTLESFKQLAEEEHFKLMVVVHPGSGWEVYNKSYTPPFFAQKIKEVQGIVVLDLMQHYLSQSRMTSENFLDYYWKFDLHHNEKGYREFANGVFSKILKEGLIDN